MDEIKFKRNHVEWGCFLFLVASFIAVIGFAYYVFFYTPEIKYEPYVDPKEAEK